MPKKKPKPTHLGGAAYHRHAGLVQVVAVMTPQEREAVKAAASRDGTPVARWAAAALLSAARKGGKS
jgi:hypothetical protein